MMGGIVIKRCEHRNAGGEERRVQSTRKPCTGVRRLKDLTVFDFMQQNTNHIRLDHSKLYEDTVNFIKIKLRHSYLMEFPPLHR